MQRLPRNTADMQLNKIQTQTSSSHHWGEDEAHHPPYLKRNFGLEIFLSIWVSFSIQCLFPLLLPVQGKLHVKFTGLLMLSSKWSVEISVLARKSLIFPLFGLNDQMTPTILVLIYRVAVWANQERHWNDIRTRVQPVILGHLGLLFFTSFKHRNRRNFTSH